MHGFLTADEPLEHFLAHKEVRDLVRLAIAEDHCLDDVTSALSVSSDIEARGSVLAKEELVVCGLPLINMIFSELGFAVSLERHFDEGALAAPMSVLATITGKAAALLAGERLILNFLQRLSGVATYTNRFVREAKEMPVFDTRKTMPGFRMLEKYAVRIGGGKNHRRDLSDLILVKNNHIDANGGSVSATLKRIKEKNAKKLPVEVEVRSIKELEEALPFQPDIVLFDNFDNDNVQKGVELVRKKGGKILIEVSGGVTLERLSALREMGVDYISSGSLTTKATNVDISLRIALLEAKEKA